MWIAVLLQVNFSRVLALSMAGKLHCNQACRHCDDSTVWSLARCLGALIARGLSHLWDEITQGKSPVSELEGRLKCAVLAAIAFNRLGQAFRNGIPYPWINEHIAKKTAHV